MKKIKFIFVGVLVFFGMMIANAATKDVTPPELKSISLKEGNKTYNVGDKVYLNIDANDDISGISQITLYLENIEWDDDTTGSCSGDEYIYDIQSNPYFVIPRCAGNGKYSIETISLVDNANNKVTYTNDNTNNNNNYLNFDMNYSVKTDRNTIVPSLQSINIDKDFYKNGENINVKISLDGDSSNIESLDVTFFNKEKDYYFNLCTFFGELFYNDEGNVWEGSVSVPSINGEYILHSISVTDKKNNNRYYVTNKNHTKEVDANSNFYYVEPIKFSVIDGFDKIPEVEVLNIDYNYKKIVAPNIYKIGIKIDDSTNIIQNARITLGLKKDDKKEFNMATDKYIYAYLYKDENGTLSGYVDIDQFNDLGVYYLAEIEFNYFNNRLDDVSNQISSNLKINRVDLFEIIEDNTYEVISSTTDKELIDKIKKANDNAKIAINSTSYSIVSKDVFASIKGTNKTIYIETGGIQWVFNGNDIKEIKDIDTIVYFSHLYNDPINKKLDNIISKGLVINFADNGKLPGKALIRVKTDYALRDYLGIDNLFVYHYINEDNILFNRVAKNISMTEDGYLEFYINHNSTFVIANKEVETKYISNSVKDLSLNDDSIKSTTENSTNRIVIYSVIGCIAIILIVVFVFVLKKNNNKGLNK